MACHTHTWVEDCSEIDDWADSKIADECNTVAEFISLSNLCFEIWLSSRASMFRLERSANHAYRLHLKDWCGALFYR